MKKKYAYTEIVEKNDAQEMRAEVKDIDIIRMNILHGLLLTPTYVAAKSCILVMQVPYSCIHLPGYCAQAVMPLLRAEWWEAHQPLVVFMWIILLVVPFAIVYGAGDTFETVLECIVNDYLTFIVLLFGLFCVSGNITVGGDFAGSPRVDDVCWHWVRCFPVVLEQRKLICLWFNWSLLRSWRMEVVIIMVFSFF